MFNSLGSNGETSRPVDVPAPPVEATAAPTVKLVACPACGRSVSTEAVSCPGCGHPLKSPTPPADADKWEEINRVGGYVALAVGTLMIGLHPSS